MSGERILVVDDDPTLQRTLRINLRARGYEVLVAGDGRTALQAVAEDSPDLVLLDLGLPDIDGVDVLRRIRRNSGLPVIVLSARDTSDDKVEALDEGGDDYVTKPFGMDELLARVRTALRRGIPATVEQTAEFRTDRVRLDFGRHEATVEGRTVHLTPTEWRLLTELARVPGRTVSQQALLTAVWGPGYTKEAHYLRVYANQVRRKLEVDPSRPRLLVTDPGLGYRLEPTP